MESSNETPEDCFYDFVARGDLWYNDSTRDLVGDFRAACMSCASKSPTTTKKSAKGRSFRFFQCEVKNRPFRMDSCNNSRESGLHDRVH